MSVQDIASITVERLAKGEYLIRPAGRGIEYVDAASAREAERIYFARRIHSLRGAAEQTTPTWCLTMIGAALRNGGVADCLTGGESMTEIKQAAESMGYHARGHHTYLLVAVSEQGLDDLKGSIDKALAQKPAGA